MSSECRRTVAAIDRFALVVHDPLIFCAVAPSLAGTYGRSCIEGRYDLYSYVPYTNIPAPVLRTAAKPAAEQAKKGMSGDPLLLYCIRRCQFY